MHRAWRASVNIENVFYLSMDLVESSETIVECSLSSLVELQSRLMHFSARRRRPACLKRPLLHCLRRSFSARDPAMASGTRLRNDSCPPLPHPNSSVINNCSTIIKQLHILCSPRSPSLCTISLTNSLDCLFPLFGLIAAIEELFACLKLAACQRIYVSNTGSHSLCSA